MIEKSSVFIFILSFLSCNLSAKQQKGNEQITMDSTAQKNLELATFGNGCFWCTEAIFEQLEGVYKVEAGYAGGTVKNPSYKEVCTGSTGHAEVIRLSYDPKEISYGELLDVFF